MGVNAQNRPPWEIRSFLEVSVSVDIARSLLREQKQRQPDYELLSTVGTAETFRLADSMVEVNFAGYLALDALPLCGKAVRALRPAIVIIMETEIWPNFIRAVSEQNIPLLLLESDQYLGHCER